MPKVAIVTDSTATIPENLLESLNIHWVPYYIHRGKEILKDLVTIQREAFYKWLPSAKELPTTACPGPGDYATVYENLAKKGVREIASIHMTSIGSGAYHSAMTAKNLLAETLPKVKIEVIDTLNGAMCHGWIAIEAARAALTGKPLSDVVALAKKIIPVTRILQTADTLKYLEMGGRIGKAKHLAASILNIKPLISMEEGVIVALGSARSTKKVYQMMVDKVEAAVGYMGKVKIAYVHAAAREKVEGLRTMVEDRLTCVETLFAELPPSLGVHTGPGTTGFCYYPVSD